MYCPECGIKNTTDARYCENCGLSLKDNTPAKSLPTNNTTPIKNTSTQPSILDGIEDAEVAGKRDNVPDYYYILSLVFWPLGIVLWALHRMKNPSSAKNIFASTIAGFCIMVLIILL